MKYFVASSFVSMPSLSTVLECSTCTLHKMQGDKDDNKVFLINPRLLCPFRSMSSISNNFPLFTPTKTTSSPSFSTPHKDRREGRWCVTDAIFRLSVREINIDTVCFLPGACWLCVCWPLVSLFSALSHFFLKNQTITDVVTEIETLVLVGADWTSHIAGWTWSSLLLATVVYTVYPSRVPKVQGSINFLPPPYFYNIVGSGWEYTWYCRYWFINLIKYWCKWVHWKVESLSFSRDLSKPECVTHDSIISTFPPDRWPKRLFWGKRSGIPLLLLPSLYHLWLSIV